MWQACALLAGGSVSCWGGNLYGELGDGTAMNATAFPVQVAGLRGAIAVGGGEFFTCAMLAGGVVECWGSGTGGQLGDGKKMDSPTPVAVKL
jgi:alpha-tubulin suppressor-like RCC1 family protein